MLAGSKQEIDDANNNVLDNMNAYLEDISSMLAGVSGALSDVNNLIPDISGGMAGALSFTNIKLNIFGCELSPNVATSDFYTFCSGGDGSPPGQLPSEPAVAKNLDSATSAPSQEAVPYVEPTRDTPTVVHDKPVSAAESDLSLIHISEPTDS